MKHIVHIIPIQKFTAGYINFMKLMMNGWRHTYIVWRNGKKPELVDNNDVIYIGGGSELRKQRELRGLLCKCDRIIVSGAFGVEKHLVFNLPWLLKKTYLHLWGGDFYPLRSREELAKIGGRVNRFARVWAIKHCGAWINLIPADYDELVKIIGKEKRHFVAPMPGDPRGNFDFDKVIAETEPHKGCRILVGNSATESNRHIDVFEMLAHLKDEDIEIVCPLSYGDTDYAARVIEKGKEIFGDKFKALTEYMNSREYRRLLATFDVGVFDHNRQQGMGNIGILLGLGKKVFMNTNNSMWTTYSGWGYKIFDVNTLKDISVDEMCKLSEDNRSENIRVHRGIYNNRMNNAKNRWIEVLNDQRR